MEQKVIDDIGKFYSHKLHKLTADIANTCERMDLGEDEVAMMVVSVLATELMNLAIHLEIAEEDFVKLCTAGFRKVAAHER